MLYGVTQEIGIDEDRVWGYERGVMLVEERGGDLGDLADDLSVFGGLLLCFCEGRGLVFLETGIALADDTLDLAELAGLLRATHLEVEAKLDRTVDSLKEMRFDIRS